MLTQKVVDAQKKTPEELLEIKHQNILYRLIVERLEVWFRSYGFDLVDPTEEQVESSSEEEDDKEFTKFLEERAACKAKPVTARVGE